MTKPFTKTFRVRWSEENALGQLDLAGYFRYVVETAWDWGASSGLGSLESEELGLAWVIRETEIRIFKPLYPNAIFDFTIWLVKWRRVRGTRCFELRLKDSGDLVAQGVQQVVALDSKTLRPISPPARFMNSFLIENPRVFGMGGFPKLQKPDDGAFVVQKHVEWRDLDSLEHVNNAIYVAIAESATIQAFAQAGWAPSRFKTQDLSVTTRRVHIKYHTPAVWNDSIDIVPRLIELNATGGTWYIDIVRISDGENIIQCLIEWSITERLSGAEQNLPDGLYNALKMLVIAGN
jgi:YbgC/YbaW family acyl-CoA thioester hydrolase